MTRDMSNSVKFSSNTCRLHLAAEKAYPRAVEVQRERVRKRETEKESKSGKGRESNVKKKT